VAESKNPALQKMREWPMFRPAGKLRNSAHDGRAPPKVADLIMEGLPGTPTQKLV
jgi:hypothetical protein